MTYKVVGLMRLRYVRQGIVKSGQIQIAKENVVLHGVDMIFKEIEGQ